MNVSINLIPYIPNSYFSNKKYDTFDKINESYEIYSNTDIFPFKQKLLFLYYENSDNTTTNLNNLLYHNKSLLDNEEFLNNKKTIIHLNEINFIDSNDSTYLEKQCKINRTSNFKSYTDTNSIYSPSTDDKLSLFKYLTYTPFIVNNTDSILSNTYYINNKLDISNIDLTQINTDLNTIFELLNPGNIDSTVEIINLLSNNNELQINNDVLFFPNPIYTTINYYLNVYNITYSFSDQKYIIILSICFYNNQFILPSYNKTYEYSQTFALKNIQLSPTIIHLDNQITQNSRYLEFDNYYLYNIHLKDTFICINHFYFNISNIIIPLDYNNIINILESKINKLVDDIIKLDAQYLDIKSNLFNTNSNLMLSFVLDTNISSNYIETIELDGKNYTFIKSSTIGILIEISTEYEINFEYTEIFKCDLDLTNLIKLFNYTNAKYGLYQGYTIKPYIITTNYYNFNTINIFFDIYDQLTEDTILLDKDNLILKIHNEKYTKELIIYDDKRFKTDIVLTDEIITEYYDTNVEDIYNSYLNNYNNYLNEKYATFYSNCVLIINLINKIYDLLLLAEITNDTTTINNIFVIIKELITDCITFSNDNLILNLTYSETISEIINEMIMIQNISILNYKSLIKYCPNIRTYFTNRLNIASTKTNQISVAFNYKQYFDIYEKEITKQFNNIKTEITNDFNKVYIIKLLKLYGSIDSELNIINTKYTNLLDTFKQNYTITEININKITTIEQFMYMLDRIIFNFNKVKLDTVNTNLINIDINNDNILVDLNLNYGYINILYV